MENLENILKEYVATANNPEYGGDYSIINSKFPELANVDPSVLEEYVHTANNPSYANNYNIINGKFPELFDTRKTSTQTTTTTTPTETKTKPLSLEKSEGVTYETVLGEDWMQILDEAQLAQKEKAFFMLPDKRYFNKDGSLKTPEEMLEDQNPKGFIIPTLGDMVEKHKKEIEQEIVQKKVDAEFKEYRSYEEKEILNLKEELKKHDEDVLIGAAGHVYKFKEFYVGKDGEWYHKNWGKVADDDVDGEMLLETLKKYDHLKEDIIVAGNENRSIPFMGEGTLENPFQGIHEVEQAIEGKYYQDKETKEVLVFKNGEYIKTADEGKISRTEDYTYDRMYPHVDAKEKKLIINPESQKISLEEEVKLLGEDYFIYTTFEGEKIIKNKKTSFFFSRQ